MRGFRGQLLTREKQSKRKLQHTSQQLHNEVGTVTPQEERACGAWSRRVYRWGHWKEEERYWCGTGEKDTQRRRLGRLAAPCPLQEPLCCSLNKNCITGMQP